MLLHQNSHSVIVAQKPLFFTFKDTVKIWFDLTGVLQTLEVSKWRIHFYTKWFHTSNTGITVFLLFGVSEGDELKKYPVLVFIHGESYEWNSGNPYDGTVLASFAGLVVVTINYRLGVLGE